MKGKNGNKGTDAANRRDEARLFRLVIFPNADQSARRLLMLLWKIAQCNRVFVLRFSKFPASHPRVVAQTDSRFV